MKRICAGLPTSVGAFLLLSAMGGTLAKADTATLLASGNEKADSFYTASRWSPAAAPNNQDGTANSVGANTDFVVCNNIKLQPPDTTVNYVFGGKSLSIGAADRSSGGIFKHKGNSRYISFADVRLCKGAWEQHNNGWMGVEGDATVYSPASDPFVFRFKEQYDNKLNFIFHGTKDSAIRIDWNVRHSNKKAIYLQADQSKTYSGSWIIGTNVYIHAIPNADYGGNSTSAMQFGKPLDEFNPAALVMEKGSMLRYEIGTPRIFSADDNRGLTVDAEGGFATYRLVNGFKHDFGWPIAGKGALKITGNGTFNLRAACGAKLWVDDEITKLVFCSGASITDAGGLVLRDGGMFSLENDTDRVTVHNIDATNAMIKLPVSADGKSCALLRLAGDVKLSGVTSIGFSQVPLVSEETDVPVIAVDSSVERVFDSSDFNPYGVTGAQLPNASGVKVVRDQETGDQVVYVTLVPCVKTKLSDGNSSAGYFEAWAWGDGSSITPAVGDGYNYLTWDTHIMNKAEGEVLTVPGASLILYNPKKDGFSFNLRHRKTTCPHLRVLDRSIVQAYSYYTGNTPDKGQPHELAGHVEVQTTPGNRFTLSATRSQINVSARITGTGTIHARSGPRFYTPQCMVQVTSVNPEYSGCFHAYNNIDVVTNTIAFEIAEEGNLGGNPRNFSPDALRLGYGCIFMPSAEITIDDENRGVTFAASTNVENTVRTGPILDLAHDFTVKTPVVFEEGEFVKRNSGTFAWGQSGATVSDGTKLSVTGGAVKPQGFDAFGSMEIAFAKGTVLAMDFPLSENDSRYAYGVDMRAVRVSHADEKLAVRLEADDAIATRSVSVPLATFADPASAEAFLELIDVSAPCGWRVEFSVSARTIGDDSVATLSADLVKIGSRIVIR